MERIAGTPEQIARRLRREVRERVGLPITVGVARTKFLAKVASAQAKPDGLLVVPPEGELAFLHPLPIEALWGVGPATAERMRRVGIETVAQVAEIDENALIMLCGKAAGRKLHALAHNRDPRRVTVGRRRRAMGTQRAFGRRQRSPAELDTMLVGLVDRLTRRLRRGRARRAHRSRCGMRHLDCGPLDALAHAAGGDREHDDAAVRVPRAARRRAPADRAARADAARDHALEPRRRATRSSSCCRSSTARRARSTPRSTTSATATAPTRSSARCCSGATLGSRSRCFQIEDRS